MSVIFTETERIVRRRLKLRRYMATWREKHPEKDKEQAKRWRKSGRARLATRKWRKSHLKEAAQSMNQWRRANPDKWRAIMRRSKRRRYWKSAHHRIKELTAASIFKATKKQGTIKSKRTLELLGTSIEIFRQWLESQFTKGMTWSNIGKFGWHIDHVKPCASFDLTDPHQQKACFHYTNLQPLWWRDNLSKGARL